MSGNAGVEATATPPGDSSGDIRNPPQEGEGNRRSRRGNRGGRNNATNNQMIVPRQPKFEGKCSELKGHIYDCSDSRQAEVYSKTTKEIAEYVGRNYKYGGDARLAVESLALPALE